MSKSTEYLRNNGLVGGDNVTLEDSQKGYSARAEVYEEHVRTAKYSGHLRIRKMMCQSYPESVRSTVRILDVAAGTGLVGKELRDAGFANIDALEPNTDMLKKAKEGSVYQNYIVEFLTREELDIPKGTYDGITASGFYHPCEEHIPVDAFYEMIRLVKPGGYICLATRPDHLKLPRYHGVEPLMKQLEQQGKWKMISRTIEPDHNSGLDGIYWAFQVL